MLKFLLNSCKKTERTSLLTRTQLPFGFYSLQKSTSYQFSILACISGIDYLSSKYRFSVVYDFLSIFRNQRLRVKTFTDEVNVLPSAVTTYINADWWEREVWDLYGIYFKNHLDLRRILTDYGFEGHPLRKDFPLSGFSEVRYSPDAKHVIQEELELAQELRAFDFESVWSSVKN